MTALSARSRAPTVDPQIVPEVSRRALPHVVRARVNGQDRASVSTLEPLPATLLNLPAGMKMPAGIWTRVPNSGT